MESSSDGSFAWTDTSSDSLNNWTSLAADTSNEKSGKNMITTENNNYKKKKMDKQCAGEISLGNTSVDIETIQSQVKEEETYSKSNCTIGEKKKMIKIEPDSDNDIHKNKKKKIKYIQIADNNNDTMAYDETYLNIKVKQEESSALATSRHKHKKKKRQSSTDSTKANELQYRDNNKNSHAGSEYNYEIDKLKQETEQIDRKIKKSKKKKEKSNHHHHSYDSDNNNLDIEEKMDVDDTVVNKLEEKNHHDGSATDKSTLQEESDESGCDEISAIKCDDSHNLHTISFDKSIEDRSTKIKEPVEKQLEVARHRMQRISDRIKFEDDDDDDANIEVCPTLESDIETKKGSSKLNQFLRTNPKLKLLTQTFNNNLDLSRDDEIWILKCPKEININDFCNTNLNMHGKSKIKIGGQTYDGSTQEEQSSKISFITTEHNKFKIKIKPVNGMIHLRKRIPKAHFHDDNILLNNQTNFIPLPETKCRHPLFGSNYKKALKIPTAIAERLNRHDCNNTLITAEKKKKKKHKSNDKSNSELLDLQIQSNFTMKSEPAPSMEKKKKKRKIVVDEGPAPKKVKLIKHDPESAEAWESEKAIEENLFNF